MVMVMAMASPEPITHSPRSKGGWSRYGVMNVAELVRITLRDRWHPARSIPGRSDAEDTCHQLGFLLALCALEAPVDVGRHLERRMPQVT